MNRDASQKRFASGVTAMTLSVVAVKVIGLVYKIPLLKILGTEGMGYFNAAYELYALFFVISTAGLPVAVSILISENLGNGRVRNAVRVHRVSLWMFAVMGIVGSLIMGLWSSAFAEMLDCPAAAKSILAISPTLLFVCISGAMRGLFQGYADMRPTAISQVVEAFGKLLLGLIFAFSARKTGAGIGTCAAFAALGITAGTLLSMIYLLLTRAFSHLSGASMREEPSVDSTKKIFKRLLFLAIPVTLSSSLAGLTRVVDMAMILRRLQATGYETSVAAAVYGSYSTLAVPVYNIPSSLVAGISLSLVPMLAASVQENNESRSSDLIISSVRICMFFAFPCSVGLAVFAEPILSLLFAGETDAVATAAPLLSVLAFSVFSSCLMGVTNAILQACHKADLPIRSMLAGTALKAISAYILIGIPQVGIYGAPISTLLCNTFAVGLNLFYIDRYAKSELNVLRISVAPMVASVLSVGASFVLWRLLLGNVTQKIAILIGIVVCVLLYLLLGGFLGVYGEKEIRMLPFGDKIAAFFLKCGWMKKKGCRYEQKRWNRRTS